ncbi:MAG: 16S rRNA (adenine(1518)-N(6)/adenine(1519)-N(6))-dimethyltransferase RsmA [Spirochaetota bacterium]
MNYRDYTRDVFSPSFITSVLKDRKLSLRKTLGQNFLINRSIALSIIELAQLDPSDSILEIGPGLGTLTFLLSEKVGKVLAVEIDRGFVRYLKAKIEEFKIDNVRVIEGDFLSFRKDEIFQEVIPNKVVCNFPYSVGIKALIKILEEFESIRSITGIMQMELARRISSPPGKSEYSFVSAYLQFMAEIRLVDGGISPRNFFPAPEVESIRVEIKRKSLEKPFLRGAYKSVVKAGFSSRRKSLASNLRKLRLNLSFEELRGIISELFSDKLIRAESLTPDDFILLTRKLLPYMN